MAKETICWGIHGGRTGDADSFFLKKNVVAIGWYKVGDLGKLQNNREAFRDAVAAAYPEKKPGSVPVNGGQLFRFVHEMSVGDLIVYPFKRDRHIHIGRIEGPKQWEKQITTPYTELTEREKESDREQVRKYLPVIVDALTKAGC